ncbi:MAG: nuclear transport factor 2 family protein [Chloroflexi bacterium]|nr:nuclear transport factor 2 family protein [Chloroflexota bacterium]
MTDIQRVIERYIDVWNATDPVRRRELIQEVFTEDAAYSDPLAAVRGHDAIDQFVAGAQAQFAGMQFSLGSAIDAHHDQARFTWHLGAPGVEEPVVIGFDVAILNDGRVRDVYGFLDKVPSGAVAG